MRSYLNRVEKAARKIEKELGKNPGLRWHEIMHICNELNVEPSDAIAEWERVYI